MLIKSRSLSVTPARAAPASLRRGTSPLAHAENDLHTADAILAVAWLALVGQFIQGHHSLGLLLGLFALLPSTMFGWAWWHTVGVVINLRRMADESRRQRWAIWSKSACNIVQIAVPVVLSLSNAIVLPVLMGIAATRTTVQSQVVMSLAADRTDTTAELEAAWSQAERSCRQANTLYRALWGSWAVAFLVTLGLYATYSILLGHALCQKLQSFQHAEPSSASFAPGASWEHKIEQRVALGGARGVGRHSSGLGIKRTTTFTDAMAQRRNNAKALADLKTTVLLNKWELVGFAAFCSSWAGLALYRVVESLGLINRVVAWSRLWHASLWIATL